MTFSSSVVKRISFFSSAIAIFVTSNILLAQTDLQLNYTFFSEDFKAPNFIETAESLNFTQDDDDDIESIIDVSKFSEAKYQNSSLKEANKVLIDETNPSSEDNNGNSPSILPYPISMLQDIEDPLEASDVAFFWHVPKAGGSTVKDIVHRCYGLTRSQPINPEPSLEVIDNNFLNVNLATPEGIHQAKEMGVMESNLLQLVVSSYFFEASELFSSFQKGRMFTMLRHPVEVAISLFYYLGTAEWEKEYDKSWANMTLMEYIQSDLVRENWMTRFLTDELEAPLTEEHVAVATQILAEKCIIGLIDKMEESIQRFETYFGWELDRRGEKCLARFLDMRINENKNKLHTYVQGSDEWDMLLAINEYDVMVYENARALFEYQAELLKE